MVPRVRPAQCGCFIKIRIILLRTQTYYTRNKKNSDPSYPGTGHMLRRRSKPVAGRSFDETLTYAATCQPIILWHNKTRVTSDAGSAHMRRFAKRHSGRLVKVTIMLRRAPTYYTRAYENLDLSDPRNHVCSGNARSGHLRRVLPYRRPDPHLSCCAELIEESEPTDAA